MRGILLPVLILFSSYAVPVNGGTFNSDGPFAFFGIGDISCGKYLSEISTHPEAANAYGWWVAGFVTGTNLAKGRVVSTDSPAHDAWLKQYCEKNPLDPFIKAATELD